MLLQRTIAICLWLFMLCILCSVFLEAKDACNHWLSFSKNYLIGISCSALIVVVSVFLQFKHEQDKSFREFKSSLFLFLSVVNIELLCPTETFEQYLSRIETLSSSKEEYNEFAYSLFWYNAKKNEEYRKLVGLMLSVTNAVGKLCSNKQTIARLDFPVEKYNNIIDSAIAFTKEDLLYNDKLFGFLKIDSKNPCQDEEQPHDQL